MEENAIKIISESIIDILKDDKDESIAKQNILNLAKQYPINLD